jgi:tRNA threonylcarbamoyladenosine biosynthesis protein TsaB
MLVLGADTSGKNGSIALVQFEPASPRTVEVVPLEGGTFSAQLVPEISDALGRHSLTKSDIDGFAVVSGPGSFTGLRVGLAAIKALAEVLRKPIAAISLLEAVVRASGNEGEVLVALDAGRGEVYVAEFHVSGQHATVRNQQLLTVGEFVSANRNRETITPDAKIADVAREKGLRVTEVERPRADVIARLGFEKIQAGEVISPESLDANYIRRSDAEIRKPGNTNAHQR